MPDIPVVTVRAFGYWIKENNRPKSVKYKCSLCEKMSYSAPAGAPKGETSYKCDMEFCSHCGAPMAADEKQYNEWVNLFVNRDPSKYMIRSIPLSDESCSSDCTEISAEILHKRETCANYQTGRCMRCDISNCDDCEEYYYMECGGDD